MSDNVISKLEDMNKTCIGCYACQNICPKNAIQMIEDREGFNISAIDVTKCVACGVCLKVCPLISNETDNTDKPRCFAVKAPDDILEISSSGGMFQLLVDHFISEGGYVCGTVYDEDFNVVFELTDDPQIISRMHGSKYVYSEMRDVYKRIKEKISSKKKVLFVGLPCQVVAVQNYIGASDYLFTVDLLGTLSSRVETS